ncbi:MAG: LapA family protein [Candidatus Cloacimonetes bacterium]|nr:LapA family protein [Candidatus Cloacimonadota bacterium]
MNPKIILLIVLAIIFIILIVQNSKPIEVDILFWSINMSQIIVFFLILLIGFVGGYIVAKLENRRKHEI